jgi:molybdopterin converting factor subunit 1
MTSISVLLFASWADAAGRPSVDVEVPDGATVADVLAAVRERVAAGVLPKPMVAVNQRYARPDAPVSATDEIAIIPPVAGG